jgi:CRISPR/Cas system CSM-associated protein Csm2 small subunit
MPVLLPRAAKRRAVNAANAANAVSAVSGAARKDAARAAAAVAVVPRARPLKAAVMRMRREATAADRATSRIASTSMPNISPVRPRYIPASRVRPLATMTANVRRLLASVDPHDRREARRSLILFKARVAFLAGRESGRERNAFTRVREFVMRGIEQVTRDREHLDPLQVRNFLDHVDAYVGYHRFHCDERRRD